MNTCHKHCFIYNTDGFEVCNVCGICSGSREMIYNNINNNKVETEQNHTDFSYILENNHIGYIQEINVEYKKIKNILKRGYPNLALYAYCTFKILTLNSIFYSISHISKMFQLENFSKYFSLIEKNPNIDKSLNFYTFQHTESSIRIFLCYFEHMNHYKKTLLISRFIQKLNVEVKPVFEIAIVLYFALCSEYRDKNNLIQIISEYFTINQRTMKKKVRNFSLKYTYFDKINHSNINISK